MHTMKHEEIAHFADVDAANNAAGSHITEGAAWGAIYSEQSNDWIIAIYDIHGNLIGYLAN